MVASLPVQDPETAAPRLAGASREARGPARDRPDLVAHLGGCLQAFDHAPSAALTLVIAEEQLDARLDEVLAKIAREGRGGLTEDENLVLQEASRRARNRRSDRV